MMVLGIDPGTITGLAWLDYSTNTPIILNSDTIITDELLPIGRILSNQQLKLITFSHLFLNKVPNKGKFKPDVVIIEDAYINMKRATAFKSLTGYILTIEHLIYTYYPLTSCFTIPNKSIRSYIFSLANMSFKGTKTVIKEAIELLIQQSKIKTKVPIQLLTEHQLDAIAMALYYLKIKEEVV